MVFGRNPQLTATHPQTVGQGSERFYLRDHPTEVFPDGIPTAGFVEMTVSPREPIALPVKPFVRTGQFQTAYWLAQDELAREDKSQPKLVGDPQYDAFKIGTSSELTFVFHITPTIQMTGSLTDDRIPEDAPIVPRTALPIDLAKQIEAYKKQLKAERAEYAKNGQEEKEIGNPPPPHR